MRAERVQFPSPRQKYLMKNILLILLIILAGVGLFFVTRNKNPKLLTMQIGKANIKYETARTAKEVELGLSYRKDLPQGQGMLFVFPGKGFRTFWMNEMLFPLDIIWIADNRVVQIDKNVPIKTNGAWTLVNPNYPADKVLELKGGEAERLGISVSDSVSFF